MISEQLKEILKENDSIMKSMNFETIVIHSKDDKCILSTRSNDDNVYFACETLGGGYTLNPFVIKDWNKMHNIMNIMGVGKDDVYSVDVSLNPVTDYPVLLTFKSPSTKIQYHPQSIQFIEMQPGLSAIYSSHKFSLSPCTINDFEITDKMFRDIGNASVMLDDKTFTLFTEMEKVFMRIGSADISVDSVEIELGESHDVPNLSGTKSYNLSNFTTLYKLMKRNALQDKFFMHIFSDKIMITSESETCKMTALIRSKQI